MTFETVTRKPRKRGPPKGKPFKNIDWDKVDQLLISGCNATQVAATLGVSPDTLYLRCEGEKGTNFSAYVQEKRATGDGYILQAQFQKALKEKNTTMLIWLGKIRLGQTDSLSKDAQDIIKSLNDIVEDSRNSKTESGKAS